MDSEPSLATVDPCALDRAALTLALASRLLEQALGDMTLPQFRVLSVVASSPERASRIAERAAMSRPTLSGLLDGLAARGWVQRTDVDGDRRGVRLEVTPDGRAALAAARAHVAARLESLLDAADAFDRTAALDGLAALGRALDAHRMARR